VLHPPHQLTEAALRTAREGSSAGEGGGEGGKEDVCDVFIGIASRPQAVEARRSMRETWLKDLGGEGGREGGEALKLALSLSIKVTFLPSLPPSLPPSLSPSRFDQLPFLHRPSRRGDPRRG